jgi:uncharacterized membrane protein YgcG
MISLFTWAPSDQSIYFLDQVFGYMDNVLPAPEGMTTIVSIMLKTVNTMALVMGSILIITTTIRGLLKTAQEGEFLGKEWSSFWVPVRTLVGVASLFPTAAGYSILQIMLMWVVVQGIGAADTLWVTVLQYVQALGSPYSIVQANNSTSAPIPSGPSSSVSGTSITIPTAIQSLMYALTCQETLARSDSDINSVSTESLYYCNPATKTSSDPFCSLSFDDRTKITSTPSNNGIYTYSIGPSGTCGTMQFPDPATYTDPNPPAGTTPVITCQGTSLADIETCAGIKQQVITLQSIVATLSMFAANIAEYDHEYIQFYQGVTPARANSAGLQTPSWISQYCLANDIAGNSCCTPSNAPPGVTCTPASTFPAPYTSSGGTEQWSDASSDLVTKIIWPYGLAPALGNTPDQVGIMTNKYLGDINTAVANAMISNTTPQGDLATASQDGWLVAGTYYYEIASKSNTNMTSTMPPFSVSAQDPSMSDNTLSGFRINFNTATSVEQTITGASNPTGQANAPTQATASSALSGVASSITGSFINELSGGGTSSNPLVAAQAFGENLLITAQVTYIPLLAISTAIITVANIDALILGSGMTGNISGPVVEFLTAMAWALYMFFAGWCFTFGGMLAIYMPLVPYILFTFGAIGWFISVLEAMVAAPFVAIGIMSPTGHEIYGRAEPSLMIILSTFLRPTLMIFGMVAGMILAPQVVTMINGGFNVVIGSIYGGSGHSPGPVELMLLISAYGSLICTTMNKCFALVFMIPDRVLTWLGGQAGAGAGGEAEALSQVKGSVDAAAGGLKDAAESGAQSMHSRGAALGRQIGNENREINQQIISSRKADITGKSDTATPGASAGKSGGGKAGGGGGGGGTGGGGSSGGGKGESATGGVETSAEEAKLEKDEAIANERLTNAAALTDPKKGTRFASKALKQALGEVSKVQTARQKFETRKKLEKVQKKKKEEE